MTRCPRRMTQACMILLLATLLGTPLLFHPASAEEGRKETENRLFRITQYLASDELEGRGIGTNGIDLAAGYIADELTGLGLKTNLVDASPFQPFKVTKSARLGDVNRLVLTGPGAEGMEGRQRIELELGVDFNPLAIGGSASFDLPLVFAGYGISAEREGYDDYEGLDVEGKAVILLRHQPQQNNPHSPFGSGSHARHAPFRAKLSNAYQHGAAAVLFATDAVELERRVAQFRRRWQAAIKKLADGHVELERLEDLPHEDLEKRRVAVEKQALDVIERGKQLGAQYDPVLDFDRAGTDDSGRDVPAVHCRRGAIDPVLRKALDQDLAGLERAIDGDFAPRSAPLDGWRVEGRISVERDDVEIKNVLAMLPGEGPLADETIVVGAHYDHLGRGGPGSAADDKGQIHNGADDNASGIAALLEVARTLVSRQQPLPRSVLFIAFTGEERGLLGSAYYVENPLVPLDKTVAMLNMDMVGRMKDEKLIVSGAATAAEFSDWLDRANERYEFELAKTPGGFGPSDHASFYSVQIPVLHFFTGTHPDYHRPSDDVEKLNLGGIREVSQFVAAMVVEIAEAPQRPGYREVAARPGGQRTSGDRPYFGSIPDFSQTGAGYRLSGVSKDGPAERAGLRRGDAILKLGDYKIANLEDFDGALRKFQAGDEVPVRVRRGEGELTLRVTLDPPRE